jgi:glycosyltransferase involved in cell wall biosynthesis
VPLRELAENGNVAVGEARAAVVVGPATGREAVARCLRSVLQHTPATVPIVVLAEPAADPAIRRWLLELQDAEALAHEVHWLATPGPPARAWTTAVAAVARADVVVLHTDVVVTEGWLEGLEAAVASLGNAASATALSNHAAFASVPHRNLPWGLLPADLNVDDAGRRVRASSLRLRPRLPTALNHCVWITRAALDLVGGFDATIESGADALVDFSHTCIAHGLQHVLADDVLVLHGGGAAHASESASGGLALTPALAARHPGLEPIMLDTSQDRFSALARALGAVSRGLSGLSVTIDGRCLAPGLDATGAHTLELIGAVARTGEASVRVIVPSELGREAAAALASVDEISIVSEDEVGERFPRTHIVHRPWHVSDPAELDVLDRLGERIVITSSDLIAYRSPQAFASSKAWLAYRRTTAEALAVASAVLFFSQAAVDDALADDLVEKDRALVVPFGVDHPIVGDIVEPSVPRSAERLAATPFLLCLGTRSRHKNLVFAMHVLERLRDDHGWDGQLAIAGAEPAHGASSGDEAAFLSFRRQLAERVVELGAVTEAEKRWLLDEAVAVLHPSTYEGFGLAPFEAAAAGTPCLFAHTSALRETLPEDAATLVPWDPARSAARVIEVLRSQTRADALVDVIRQVSGTLTWDVAAPHLLSAYAAAASSPAPAMARVAARVAKVEHDYWALRADLGPLGFALVGEDDRFLDEETQRGLARIASRQRLRGPLRAALKAVARLPSGR